MVKGRRHMMRYSNGMGRGLLIVALLVAGLAVAVPANADTFNLTSCHISTGCPPAGTIFGTVTLNQSGSNVNVDVVLANGSRFVETAAGGGALFLFNDQLAGSTVTTISVTLNVATVTIPGGLTGSTNLNPLQMADGTGDWSAAIQCTTASSCNGGSTPNINDLHFTVTNATLAQLEVQNNGGNLFVADILCGAGVSVCGGLTGPVDVSPGGSVPEPASLLLLGA